MVLNVNVALDRWLYLDKPKAATAVPPVAAGWRH